MKTQKVVLFLLAIVCGLHANAQSAADIFYSSETKLTWLGIDFTHIKIIGEDFSSPRQLKDYFEKMNDVVITEAKKYDLEKAFHKSAVGTDLRSVTKLNEGIDMEKVMGEGREDCKKISDEAIQSEIKKYTFDKEGYGVVFLYEWMFKHEKDVDASIWVVFVDMATKKVVLSERMNAKPGGIGFRNYWVKPVKEVLEEIAKKKYKEWKKSSAK